MADDQLEIGQRGWLVGSGTWQYRLKQRIGRPSGEGEVWRATRSLDGVPRDYALKILRLKHVLRDNDADMQAALDRWLGIWRDTVHRGRALASIRGVVPTYEAFQDVWPRPTQDAPKSSAKTLYLASEWVDGEELGDWLARESRSPSSKADLIHQLCHLVDQVAERGLVHRDLSLRNVLVDNTGAVSLIDFSFMRAAGSPDTDRVGTPGYAAPEAGTDPARDRYSVGAMVYALLTEANPPIYQAAERARWDIHYAGYSVELAEHVAALVHPEPQQRPRPLSAWATTFHALLAQPKAPTHYADVALALSGDGFLELAAAGTGYVAVGRNRSGFRRLAAAEAGPRDVTALDAARRGNGGIALFAIDRRRSLWVRAGRQWEQAPTPPLAGPVRATPQGDGTTMGFVSTGSGRLLGIEVSSRPGLPLVHEFGVEIRRVVAAGTSPAGQAVVAVETPRGHLLCGAPEELASTGLRDVLAAAVTVDQWGVQICIVHEPSANRIVRLDRLKDGWAEREDFRSPPGTRDVACVGHRGGISIAIAADTGVCVWSEELDDWTVIGKAPASRVVVALGVGGLVQVAAVASRRILYGVENGPGIWWPDSMTEVA
ncbi:protein kinase domain-containing protein [Dactylosporangium sp. CA-092794]|uniref:protein kinase domain-containing protein n=1 Tax=Dactylosporangium sp. CA-092794 TaxID=3239929 RepID=UPI003D940B9A